MLLRHGSFVQRKLNEERKRRLFFWGGALCKNEELPSLRTHLNGFRNVVKGEISAKGTGSALNMEQGSVLLTISSAGYFEKIQKTSVKQARCVNITP